jgi:hypothetical protein
MSFLKTLAISTAFTIGGVAHAATVTVITSGADTFNTVDVTQGTALPVGVSFTPDSDISILSGSPTSLSPFSGLGLGNFEMLDYFAVGNPNFSPDLGRGQAAGIATLDFGADVSAVEFIWGSPDYTNEGFVNEVFTMASGAVQAGFSPNDFSATLDTLDDEARNSVRVRISSSVAFDSLVFKSGDLPYFEFANLNVEFAPSSGGSDPSPVPLPAGGLLLVTALGTFVAARKQRKG